MRTLLTLLSFILPALIFGQKLEGVVHFDEKLNMHRNLPPDANDVRAMIPEYQVNQSLLYFDADESLFQNDESEEEEDADMGDGQMQIKIQRPEALIYRNYAASRKTEQRDFMGKKYLIVDTLLFPSWKITGQTKTILGYNCMQATMSDTARHREITVWFADALPVSAGPATYCGLPGLVLEADVNQGEMIWTATKVEFRALKKGELTVPSKGEKIGSDAYDALVAERMKAMGGGGIRIIRN